eukprot:3937181-Rhodomonas_salina.1
MASTLLRLVGIYNQNQRQLLHVLVGALFADRVLLRDELQHLRKTSHAGFSIQAEKKSEQNRQVENKTSKEDSYEQLVEDVVCFVEVEDEVKLAHVPEIAVQHLHKLVDDLERDQLIICFINCPTSSSAGAREDSREEERGWAKLHEIMSGTSGRSLKK